jgi:chemotaxis protein MotB
MRWHGNTPILPIPILGLALVGCVSSGRYQAKVVELEEAQKDAVLADHERRNQIDLLQYRFDKLNKQMAGTLAELDRLAAEKASAERAYDESTALVGALEARLAKLGQNVDRLAAEKGTMAATLEDARKRLEELRKQKLAAEERAATFRMIAKKLHGMIDEGDLMVTIRDGRMLLVMPTDVLFDSGKTEIKEGAKEALAQVASVLASFEGRRYEVAGHTDDVPIHTRQFPSNWELSTQRAVEVTKLLIANGLGPERLSAAGYGEYDPVAPNDSMEGRAENRRIEITVLPKLEELPPHEDIG